MGAASFSKPLLRHEVVFEHVNLFALEDIGHALAVYIKTIGFNETKLSKATFQLLFESSAGTATSTHAGAGTQAVHMNLFDAINANCPEYGGKIPALQLFALLYMLSAPHAQSVDEKFDAIIGLCQFKPIPDARPDTFNHCVPNTLCTKAD